MGADTHLERPCLRGGLEHRPARQGGQQGLMLFDRLGVIDTQTFVPQELLPIIGRFDGCHTVAEIESAVFQRRGPSPAGFVASLVKQLDNALLLQGPRWQLAIESAADEFTAAGFRPCRHAGSAGYPADRTRLTEALDDIVPLASAARGSRTTPLRGVVSPHIDLARGRDGYAAAWQRVLEHSGPDGSPPADLFVIFGTGHQGPSQPLVGLPLDWRTPLGGTRTDKTFVHAVHGRTGTPEALDVLLHRGEHSIEFQVLMLQHLFPQGGFEVACFLTGGVPCGATDEGRLDPRGERWFQRAETALRQAAYESGKRVCYVAGADLAHVGPFFGDAARIDDARLQTLDVEERARLAYLERGDVSGFFNAVEAPGNPDRVCGTAPILWTLTLASDGRPSPAELLHYGQAVDPRGEQVVSFCGMAITDC